MEGIAGLVGLVGLLVTAVLSSAGYFYKNRLEGKKSARKVLYLLLEIRQAVHVSMFDPEEATQEYLEYCTKRLREKGTEIDFELLGPTYREMIESHFVNVSQAMKTDIEARLISPFEQALSELSGISPVLAYRLRGQEKLELLAKVTSAYTVSARSKLESIVENEIIISVLEQAGSNTKNMALDKISNHMDNEILILSKHCGWLDWYQCKKLINNDAFVRGEHDFSDLDATMDMVFNMIYQELNKQSHQDVAVSS